MVFNSEKKKVTFEPGDIIRCKNAEDAAILGDMFADIQVQWEFLYRLHGQRGIWIIILAAEEAAEE